MIWRMFSKNESWSTRGNMVWDNFLTDGWSIWAGIDFIKVKPIEIEEENPSVWRGIQKVMRSFADNVARVRGNIK